MIQTTTLPVKENWKELFHSSVKRSVFISGTILIIAITCVLPAFFNKIEHRNGLVLHDWVLASLPSHNFSIAIFSIIWGMGLLTLYRAVKNPAILITYIWAMIFVIIARIITIRLVPLNPPVGLVPLADPVNDLFYGHSLITKDLFFSGHTASLVLMFLCMDRKADRVLAFIAIVVLVVLLLIQHIHYTVDIIAAPIIVYVIFRMTRLMLSVFDF